MERGVVTGLRRLGIDVLTVAEAGELGRPDEEHLERAVLEGRTFYTLNVKHFAKLHNDWLVGGRQHSGILTFPKQRYSIGEKIRRIAEFIDSKTAEEMIDQMIFL